MVKLFCMGAVFGIIILFSTPYTAFAIDYNSPEFKQLYQQQTGKKYGGGAGHYDPNKVQPNRAAKVYGGGASRSYDQYDASRFEEAQRMIDSGNLNVDRITELEGGRRGGGTYGGSRGGSGAFLPNNGSVKSQAVNDCIFSICDEPVRR